MFNVDWKWDCIACRNLCETVRILVNLWFINFCCTATHHVLPRIKQTQSTQLGPAYKAIRHAYSIVPHIMVIYTDFTANAKK